MQDSITCPICLKIFTNPVCLTASGITYDLGCINEHVRVSETHPSIRCPKSQIVLPLPITVVANFSVRNLVDDFHETSAPERVSAAQLEPHPWQGLYHAAPAL